LAKRLGKRKITMLDGEKMKPVPIIKAVERKLILMA
jgi:hypothetical protein